MSSQRLFSEGPYGLGGFEPEHLTELWKADLSVFDPKKIPCRHISSYAVAAVVCAQSSGNKSFLDVGEELSNELQRRMIATAKSTDEWRTKFANYKAAVMQDAGFGSSFCGRHRASLSSPAAVPGSITKEEDEPAFARNERPIRRESSWRPKHDSYGDGSSDENDRPPLARPFKRRKQLPSHEGQNADTRSNHRFPPRNVPRLLPRIMGKNDEGAVDPEERRYQRYAEG